VALDPSEIGAFLSGAAAIISAVIGSKVARRRSKADCEQRIKEITAAIHEGYRMRQDDQ